MLGRLYHYYEREWGPFRNLSLLPPEEAAMIQSKLIREGRGFAGKRPPDYLQIRSELESRARDLFIQKGGAPRERRPHYMVLGASDWLRSWYNHGEELSIPFEAFDPLTLSFTYGDLFPTFRIQNEKPYRGQLYTWREIAEIIERYGYPQVWNSDGSNGPERYIEVQVWDFQPLRPWMNQASQL